MSAETKNEEHEGWPDLRDVKGAAKNIRSVANHYLHHVTHLHPIHGWIDTNSCPLCVVLQAVDHLEAEATNGRENVPSSDRHGEIMEALEHISKARNLLASTPTDITHKEA